MLLTRALCCAPQDINMDHHRAAPYSILWSNINTGIGSRTFESSGDGGGNGNHSASFSTFWNVRCARKPSTPACITLAMRSLRMLA